MTRLEEIERQARDACKQRKPVHLDATLYAIDCYKARVAVLEEALRPALECIMAPDICGPDDLHSIYVACMANLALTPEQCLERQKGVG